jgi:hypothetical protein
MSYVYSRALTAQGPIFECRFVKPGTTSGTGLQAAGATDSIIGVTMQFNHPQTGQRFDYVPFGPAQLLLGGQVNAGDLLTSDANGCGITVTRHAHVENTSAAYTENANTATAPTVRIGAMALVPGNEGDVIDVIVVQTLA